VLEIVIETIRNAEEDHPSKDDEVVKKGLKKKRVNKAQDACYWRSRKCGRKRTSTGETYIYFAGRGAKVTRDCRRNEQLNDLKIVVAGGERVGWNAEVENNTETEGYGGKKAQSGNGMRGQSA